MGIINKAKNAAAVGGIIAGVAGSPVESSANIARTNDQAKAQMKDRANAQASRLRSETRAKGIRSGGSSGHR